MQTPTASAAMLSNGAVATQSTTDPIFLVAPTYAMNGTRSMSVAVADLNRDGRPDLIVPNLSASNQDPGHDSGGISVLLARPDGTYDAPVEYVSGNEPASSIVVGDFNRDTKPDLAVSGGYVINILLGNGDGTLRPPLAFAAGQYNDNFDIDDDLYGGGSRSMALADFNGDTLVDIAFTNGHGGEAGVILGRGDGTFSPPSLFPAASSFSQQVVVDDLNRDGKPDLAIADRCSHLPPTCMEGGAVVLLGNGDGTFRPSTRYATGGRSAAAIAVGDLNGDGSPDIAVANARRLFQFAEDSLGVLFGDGSGTFAPPVVYPTGPQGLTQPTAVAIADFNNDHKLDISVLQSCHDCETIVSVFVGNGEGAFRMPPRMYLVPGGDSLSFAVADLNADNLPDLAVSTVWRGVTVLLGNRDGRMQAVSAFGKAYYATSFGVASDFNGDGKDDLAVVNECAKYGCARGSLTILLGDGREPFRQPQNYQISHDYTGSITAGDFNHDGKPDLVLTGSGTSRALAVLLGNGRGGFQFKFTYPLAASYYPTAAVADFNGDANLDVVIAPGLASGAGAAVFLGNGDGTLQAPIDYGAGATPDVAVTTADLNRDGKPDLVLANPLQVMLGNGDGTFQPAAVYPQTPGNNTVGLLALDLNADGKLDLVVGRSHSTEVMFGSGDGTFQSPVTYQATGKPVAADFNGDGIIDLALAYNAPTLLTGIGGGLFEISSTYNQAAAWILGDFNRDGKPDLAGTGYSTGVATVLFNIAKNFHYATSTALISSANPAQAGQNITFTASVIPAFERIVSGSVTLYDGSTALDTQPVLNGKATFSSAFTAGQHVITAVYGGDARHLSSTSAILTQTITPTDTTPPWIILTVTPQKLWPPDGRMVPVKVQGTVTDTGSGVLRSSAQYSVSDEYRLLQPRGSVTLNSAGGYSFVIYLRATRKAADLDGRHYWISISAKDNAGNRRLQSKVVTVPHDQQADR